MANAIGQRATSSSSALSGWHRPRARTRLDFDLLRSDCGRSGGKRRRHGYVSSGHTHDGTSPRPLGRVYTREHVNVHTRTHAQVKSILLKGSITLTAACHRLCSMQAHASVHTKWIIITPDTNQVAIPPAQPPAYKVGCAVHFGPIWRWRHGGV